MTILATTIATLLLAGAAFNASAHDLFVSMTPVPAGSEHATTAVINNGTFNESAGAVTRDRLQDVSLRSDGIKAVPDLAGWKVKGRQSFLTLHPPREGTFLLGISTKASTSTRTAREFGTYLELEDLPDTLATYAPGNYPKGVTYSYTKHARAIGQTGATLTEDYAASLDYPLEIRLLSNPGNLKVGETLMFEVLHEGVGVPHLRVYVGHRAETPAKGGHSNATLVRTDGDGRASFNVTTADTWYIHTNHMLPSTQNGLDFVSDRASLTFDILAQEETNPVN